MIAIQHDMKSIYMSFKDCAPDIQAYETLKTLADREKEILNIEETSWKLKSRNRWLKDGDRNSNFFHKCASDRRSRNTIWRIQKDDGSFATSTLNIQEAAHSHFKSFYQQDQQIDDTCQRWVIDNVRIIYEEADIISLDEHITSEEVEGVL